MTEKICKKCGTYVQAGKFCPECGTQLYPDVGETVWIDLANPPSTLKLCNQPKFDVWTGEKLEEMCIH